MKNLVSIITPSYNSEKFISQTIESVLKQVYKNWEMIIVDDCSPDNSNKIIEEYCKKDSRIRLIKLEQNSGPAIARNTAIKEAEGRYIAFLDADDLWLPEKLEKQITFMKTKDCAFSNTYYQQFENVKLTNRVIISPDKYNYNDLLKSNFIGCLTAIYDVKKIDKIYMPLIKKRQDYGLWLNILKKIENGNCLPEILSLYRVGHESTSKNKFDLIKYNYKLFKEHQKLSVFKSVYYVGWNIYIKIFKRNIRFLKSNEVEDKS